MNCEKTNVIKVARIVSVVGHPFVLLPLTTVIAVSRNSSPVRTLAIGIITVLVTVVPLLLIIRRKVATGKWSDMDVSVSSERDSFYPIAITVVIVSGLIFWILDFPRSLLIGIIISLVLLLAAMIINRRSKISLHLIFAVYCAVCLFAVSYLIGAGFILLSIAIGWSRILLERHNFGQVLSGMMLGAFAGICLLKAVGFF